VFIKVYFDNKPLFLCDEVDEEIQPYVHHDDAVFIDELDSHSIKSMVHEMQLPKVHAGVFFHPDLTELKKSFFKKFTVIQAGGGLVMNNKDQVLLIHRRGKWDLPKGKLDRGERIEDCALREVREETGLTDLDLLGPLTITYHTYEEGSKHMLKESHWFRMRNGSMQPLIPQAEENITDIRWVNKSELQGYLENTFPSVADVLQQFVIAEQGSGE
jgi:8-oxo-dGTP pyrophosphatase MutT (NUDIX family)